MFNSELKRGGWLRALPIGLIILFSAVGAVAQYDIAEEPFWPFSPADEITLFGPSGLRVDIPEKDPIYEWNQTIREFTAQRKVMAKLNSTQEDVLDQFGELRSLFGLDSVLISDMERRGKPYQLFQQAMDNETEIERIQAGLREKCQMLLRNVPAIQKRLIDVRSRLDAASLELRDREQEVAVSRLTQADILKYKQQLSDAIDRLALVIKDNKNALNYLMSAMNSYSSNAYEGYFLIEGLEERVQRLIIRNKAAIHQINVNERELKSLSRQLESLISRQEELQQLAAEKEISSALDSQITAKQERMRQDALQRAADAEIRAAAEARKADEAEKLARKKDQELAQAVKDKEVAEKKTKAAQKDKEAAEKEKAAAEKEKEDEAKARLLEEAKQKLAEKEQALADRKKLEADRKAEKEAKEALDLQKQQMKDEQERLKNEQARLEAERVRLEAERERFEADQIAAVEKALAEKEAEEEAAAEKERMKADLQRQARAEADAKVRAAMEKEDPKTKKKSFWGKIITLGGLIGSSDADEKKDEVKKKSEEKKEEPKTESK